MGKTRIFVNDIDVSEFNSSLTSFISFEKDKIIGNVSSKELTMKLENKNGEFNDLLDSPFVLKDEEGNQLGVYYVFKNPERMTSELSLTLYDSIVFSNVFYDSKLEYPCTIEEQLIEMEELIGIEIDFSMVPSEVLNRKINFYDNRETIRTFLGWIAEISSCNVYATPSGSYKFVQLSILASHDITDDDVEKFDKIENYELSGIKYDNGVVIPILSGDETKNVYRLDETNIYLESQENIDLIYSKLVGLTFATCKDFKLSGINGLQLGDLINNADRFIFMAMSIKQEYLNAVYDIQEISGELSTKNISKVNVVSNNDTRIKRIQTIVDQNNNSLKIIAQDVKDQEERIGQLELNEKEFKVEFKETVTKVEEIKSKKMYRLVIYSTNGNIFRNGQIETELYAVVYSWDDEITDTLDENQFIWTRKSNDHEADIIWNQEHFGGAKRIVITADDVYARATFFCDLIDTTTRMSLL